MQATVLREKEERNWWKNYLHINVLLKVSIIEFHHLFYRCVKVSVIQAFFNIFHQFDLKCGLSGKVKIFDKKNLSMNEYIFHLGFRIFFSSQNYYVSFFVCSSVFLWFSGLSLSRLSVTLWLNFFASNTRVDTFQWISIHGKRNLEMSTPIQYTYTSTSLLNIVQVLHTPLEIYVRHYTNDHN